VSPIVGALYLALSIYAWLIIIRALLSWFRPRPGTAVYPVYDLLVRVTGYNAYFTSIGRELQDEIIARELHAGA